LTDRHQGTGLVRATVVDPTRDEFLANAGFAEDQDSGFGVCNGIRLIEDRSQCAAGSNDAVDVVICHVFPRTMAREKS